MQGTTTRRDGVLLPVRPGWWFDLLLLAGFGALSVALARGRLLGLDERVADWVDAHRPGPAGAVALAVNQLGQGGKVLMPVTILLAAALTRRCRSVRPLLVFVAAFGLIYLSVGPLKVWFSRAAPHSLQPGRAELFHHLPAGEYTLGYPSGHVANALVWYAAIALLANALRRAYGRPPLPPVAVAAIRVLPPVLIFASTTYLAFHWITDSLAGLLLGLVLARLLARIPFDTLPLPGFIRWPGPAHLPPQPDRG